MTAASEVSDAWLQTVNAARREAQRLMALGALDLIDTPAEPELDRITRLAAKLLKAPIALLSLVDANRQWFKSAIGFPMPETPRGCAFCDWAIRSPNVFVVLDARLDPRFAPNPMVTGFPNIAFYAGAPLSVRSDQRIGALCIMDHVPRSEFNPAEQEILSDLAALAVALLTARHCGEPHPRPEILASQGGIETGTSRGASR
jgi:GAF domain-containing protein